MRNRNTHTHAHACTHSCEQTGLSSFLFCPPAYLCSALLVTAFYEHCRLSVVLDVSSWPCMSIRPSTYLSQTDNKPWVGYGGVTGHLHKSLKCPWVCGLSSEQKYYNTPGPLWKVKAWLSISSEHTIGSAKVKLNHCIAPL